MKIKKMGSMYYLLRYLVIKSNFQYFVAKTSLELFLQLNMIFHFV